MGIKNGQNHIWAMSCLHFCSTLWCRGLSTPMTLLLHLFYIVLWWVVNAKIDRCSLNIILFPFFCRSLNLQKGRRNMLSIHLYQGSKGVVMPRGLGLLLWKLHPLEFWCHICSICSLLSKCNTSLDLCISIAVQA